MHNGRLLQQYQIQDTPQKTGNMESGLANRVVLVTGASGGIGGAIVEVMAEEKARIVIHYHQAVERANQLKQLADSHGAEAYLVQADLTQDNDVEEMFTSVENEFGRPEVLVANAGVWPAEHQPLLDLPLERWEKTISQNLGSVVRCTKRFLLSVQQSGIPDASIVMTGSTAGWFGEAGHSDYASAKAGLMFGLLQSLKNEITQVSVHGRINAVCPGWTVTPMTDKFTGNETAVLKALKTIPMNKFASARDIANAITFLASSQLAGHISGQTLFVSGGMEGRIVNDAPNLPVS